MEKNIDKLTPMQKSAYALKKLRARLDKLEKKQSEPIAIIGMSCRFPQASNCSEFWELLHNGVNAVKEIPIERWQINDFYDPDPNAPGKINTKFGGFLTNIDQFDADFFSISLREAARMDPQQRILLEVTWEALENAGQSPQKMFETMTGVYLGFNQTDYGLMHLKSGYKNLDLYTATGNGYCFGAGRIAYNFGFHGPAMSIDTACSSSMVALHEACNGLRTGDCNMAIAGGIQLNLTPDFHLLLTKTNTLSPSGACKTFDADADGLVLGEGCGVVVLKRLSEAISNNDNILALILSTGVNHGGSAGGITVPNEIAQEKIIRQVLEKAKVDPLEVNFIETHGTGTLLGDPIEFNAIDSIFGDRSINNPLIIGSVKTNIGHLDAASGIAGLIKTVLSIQNNEIPSNLHFKNPSPKIDWSKGNIKVASKNIEWKYSDKRRIAGVSSFGISGTNTHVVIEEAPTNLYKENDLFKRPAHIFTLSAKNEKALLELAKAYSDYFEKITDEKLENICFTANTGRNHFKYRLAAIINSKSQLHDKINDFINNNKTNSLYSSEQQTKNLLITFYFPEENSQFIGKCKQLYDTQPVFNKTINNIDSILKDQYNISLISILYDKYNNLSQKYIQLAAFSIEYALSSLWQSWGIKPSIIAGFGVGEIAANCMAGTLNINQSIKLILEDNKLENLNLSKSKIKIISGESSKSDLIKTILKHKSKYIIELGTETNFDDEKLLKTNEIMCLQSIENKHDDWEIILNSLAKLYLKGANINWESFDKDYFRKRVQLPTYKFQRKRYWKNDIEDYKAPLNQSLNTAKTLKEDKIIESSDNKPLDIDKTNKLNDNKNIKDFNSNSPISRIMAQQLKAVSDSMVNVVSQQLNFLNNKGFNKNIIQEKLPTKPDKIEDIQDNNNDNPANLNFDSTLLPLSTNNEKELEKDNNVNSPNLNFDSKLLLLSANTEKELENETKNLIEKLKTDFSLDDIIYELRREPALSHRRMLVCKNKDDCLEALEKNDKKRVFTSISKNKDRPIAFLFPGVGDHYVNMSKKLYDRNDSYRKHFNYCCDILKPYLEQDLREVIFAKKEKDESDTEKPAFDFRKMFQRTPIDENSQRLNLPVFSHAGVFVVEYSLAQLWMKLGIMPQASIGYSIGEYVSACLSRVIALEDVLPVIVKRAQMIQDLPEGAMLAVPLSEKEILPHLDESHSIAILSTDSQCVIAGTSESIDSLELKLTEHEILFRRLQNTHAVHSKLMEPIREPLTMMFSKIKLRSPEIPYLSNVTGTWINEAQAVDPHYWAQHTCQTARFVDGIGELLNTPERIFLEVGPGQSLGSFVYQHSKFSEDCIVISSLRTVYDGQSDDAFLLNMLGKLWLGGTNINFNF